MGASPASDASEIADIVFVGKRSATQAESAGH
jgi:hypothetical protein